MTSRDSFPTGDFQVSETTYFAFALPDSDWVKRVFLGALLLTMDEFNWEQRGTTTEYTASEIFNAIYGSLVELDTLEQSTVNIGTLYSVAYNTPHANELLCDGSTYNRVDYPELYALLDAEFIESADTFKTPDLRGRVVGMENGSNWSMGERTGSETVTLTVDELASHNHPKSGFSPSGNAWVEIPRPNPDPLVPDYYGGLAWDTKAQSDVALMLDFATGSNGGNQAHNNMQPTVFLNWMIRAK